MACDIPAPSKEAKVAMDFTVKQKVVKIDIVPDPESVEGPPARVPALQTLKECLDNSHKTEIVLGKICIRVGDTSDNTPRTWGDVILADITVANRIYLITGYTDYPRSIVILEDCCEKAHHNNLLTDNSNNDITVSLKMTGIVLLFSVGNVGSGLLPNYFSFHSLSFLLTVS